MTVYRTKDKPTIVTDIFDDISSIGDVSQMYSKFVRPIDTEFRSIATAPGLGTQSGTTRSSGNEPTAPDEKSAQEYLLGQDVDPSNFPESRCHAFYRMVGLPVVSQDGFYNPGHDPNQGSTTTGRSTVDNSLKNNNQELLNLAAQREQDAINRRRIFSRQDDVAIAYSLLLRNPKRFLVAEVGQDPFYIDKQNQPVEGRTNDIKSFNLTPELQSSITSIAISPSHILKPFIVIPSIENAVTPAYKKRICVPFLRDVAATKTTTDKALKRPIIEYIIRQRLKSTERDTLFIQEAQRVISNASNTDNTTSSSVRNALLALSGQTSLAMQNKDIIDNIQGFTTIQAKTIVLFIKGIQTAIKELSENVRSYNEIISANNIQPVPSVNGPEFGGAIKTTGGIKNRSQVDQKIAELELIRVLSQFQSQQSSQVGDESVYASAIAADLTKGFDKEIRTLTSERDKFGAKAINNLKAIEIITGEISGFGLIDILAVYTALWAISIEDLLGLLDNNALSRLQEYFPDLAPAGSEARAQLNVANRNINEVLTNFESMVFNILTYADGILEKERGGPRRSRKGSI